MTIMNPLNNENRLSEGEAFKQKLEDLNRRLVHLKFNAFQSNSLLACIMLFKNVGVRFYIVTL